MVVPGMYLADRYEILEKIGSGGMADVYKAKDHKLNRLVAAKVLKNEFSVDETFVKKFRVEAQAAAGLSHPNIVNVYDVGEENGIHYIVMELVQGITLKKYIEMKGKLEIKEALNISVQIASGLQAAHDNRIIHRDVKPQNIIMSRDGKVKVTDFGIAKMADSTTVTTNAAGSVHYISPEQARGGYSDAKSDIYSLGITMYEMLTGRVPFEGETNVAVALLHIQGEMIPPRRLEPSIPRSFEKIILKCTQKKPERRYTSARDLISDLRKVLTHPDGEYVNLSGAAAMVNEQTVVLGAQSSSGSRQSTSGNAFVSGSGRSASSGQNQRGGQVAGGRPDPRQNGSGQGNSNRTYAGKNGSNRNMADDDDNEGVNPALEKVMMVLGIVGAVILVVVIFFIIGKAAGLFSGGGQTESAIESTSSTETIASTDSESESESKGEISVPDLYDMTEEQAQLALKKDGLYLSIKKGSSDSVAGGHIYKQDPIKGSKVEKGSVINVWVNAEETEETDEEVIINDVAGLSVTRAQTALGVQGLVVTDIKYEFSDTLAADTVIRTDPPAGTSVKKGTSVLLYISKGKEIEKTEMPQVVGLSLDAAIAELTKAGLNYGGATTQSSSSVPKDKVISASYSFGESLDKGTTVSFVVSSGPQSESESENSQPQVYHSTIAIYDSPVGGLNAGETASVLITVYKPDGTMETIYNGQMSVDAVWAPLEQDVTSSVAGQGHYEIVVNGASAGQQTITFN